LKTPIKLEALFNGTPLRGSGCDLLVELLTSSWSTKPENPYAYGLVSLSWFFGRNSRFCTFLGNSKAEGCSFARWKKKILRSTDAVASITFRKLTLKLFSTREVLQTLENL
jgi:hypothetical protein